MDFSSLTTHETLGYVLEHGFFPERQVGCIVFLLDCKEICVHDHENYTNETILEIAEQLGVTFPSSVTA